MTHIAKFQVQTQYKYVGFIILKFQIHSDFTATADHFLRFLLENSEFNQFKIKTISSQLLPLTPKYQSCKHVRSAMQYVKSNNL